MSVTDMGNYLVLLIMVMCCWPSMAKAEYVKYKDPKQPIGMRIKDLMKRMTLEEKIGQMTQISSSSASNEIMKKRFIGSVLSMPGSVPEEEASPRTWIDMVNDFQNGSLSSRLRIPMIYGIDAVHGHNAVYNATIFPHNVGLGVTRDPVLVKKIGAATALEVRATGIQYTFAPCIADHRDLAREAVRKTLVLLKNGKSSKKPMLPLPKKATKILVAGSHADNLGYQCGGWTIEHQGFSGNNVTIGTTILSAVRNTVDKETQVVYNENPNDEFVKSNKFDFAMVVVGEHSYAETSGDSTNLTIPESGPSVIKNVCSSVKCVVVLITGRPVVIEPYVATIDALVAAWLPGTEGQGIPDVLFGDYPFTGKLARTWFKSVDQLPMNVGDPHYDPLYPFGFGLTTKDGNNL